MGKFKYFSKVRWQVADVQSIRESWTLTQCRDAIEDIERNFDDRMIELGWEVLDNLLPAE